MRAGLAAGVLLGFVAGAAAQTAAAQTPASQPDVDLKLFEKAEADRSRGCTVALWQADRDPTRTATRSASSSSCMAATI